MGFHYVAYPVDPSEVAQALSAPMQFVREAQTQASDRLELGRCWRCLQSLLKGNSSRERPSADLVRTPTAHAGIAQQSYTRALEPPEVAAIADDLERLLREQDGQDLDVCLFAFPADAARPHLERALAFTRRLADTDQGLVYRVGTVASGSADE